MAVEEEDAFDQAIRVAHLADRLFVNDLTELVQTPVPQHARGQKSTDRSP
jgi:hypothetical protein